MRGLWRAVAFGLISFAVTNMAQAAEVRAFVTGAARPMVDLLVPQFERATGHKLVITSALPPELVAKVEAGEPFDVIVLSYDVEALIKRGQIEANSRTLLGQTGIGVAIHTGAPKPDFSTVEKFKQMLLNAKSLATSGEGSSGRYVASLVERLGIADQVKAKMVQPDLGVRVGTLIADGKAEIGVQQVGELLPIKGITFLGPLPSELQTVIVYGMARSVNAKQWDAASMLVKYLTAPSVGPALKKIGLDPA